MTKIKTKPFLAWHYGNSKSEYPIVPDARLNVNMKTETVVSVEYPLEPSNWADTLINKTLTEVEQWLSEQSSTYVLMKDCW